MPELPEVTTVIAFLKKKILNKTIKNIKFVQKKVLKNASIVFCNCFLQFQKISNIHRYGKNIVFETTNFYIFSHLRMEGKYKLINNKNIPSHCMFYFVLNKNLWLCYCDTRYFGTLKIIFKKNNSIRRFLKIGYEPFDKRMTKEYFFSLTKKSNRAIKTFLLDQGNIAGIGNIYANEILFDCKIHPMTTSKLLNIKQCEQILSSTNKILKDAINLGGTTIHSFSYGDNIDGKFQNLLKVHNRQNQLCKICNNYVQKIFINKRGTYYCNVCQKQSNISIKK